MTASFLLQKRTWESNKNDIRVCRMKGKHEVKASPAAVKLLDPFFTWIKTITRMGGTNSCQRYLISFGCACLRVFTQIWSKPIKKPALHLITLSQAVRRLPSSETISAEHLCCASYIHVSSLEVHGEKWGADRSLTEGKMMADSVSRCKGNQTYKSRNRFEGTDALHGKILAFFFFCLGLNLIWVELTGKRQRGKRKIIGRCKRGEWHSPEAESSNWNWWRKVIERSDGTCQGGREAGRKEQSSTRKADVFSCWHFSLSACKSL